MTDQTTVPAAEKVAEMKRQREALLAEVNEACSVEESLDVKAARITSICERYRPSTMLSLLVELVTRERLATMSEDRTFQAVVMCIGCGQGVEAPLPLTREALALQLARLGWFLSIVSEPNPDPKVPITTAPLCSPCAQKMQSPEAFKAADDRRRQAVEAAK
jgi:hypothetical protein